MYTEKDVILHNLHPTDNSDFISETHQVQLDTNMLISEVEFQVIDDDIIETNENFTVKITDITPDVMIFNEMSSATIQVIDDDDGMLISE